MKTSVSLFCLLCFFHSYLPDCPKSLLGRWLRYLARCCPLEHHFQEAQEEPVCPPLRMMFFNAQSFSADGQYVANLSTDLEMYCKSITFANIDDTIDFNFTTGTPGGIWTQARLIVYQNLTLSDMVNFDYDDGRGRAGGQCQQTGAI